MKSDQLLKINYKHFTLENGLKTILYRDVSVPVITTNVWYRVGSANEVTGKTGFAHLFEHMMFQGSQNIPKEGHFKFIQEAGGSLNGSTSFDRTNYYETLPANYLELALWLESDRMGFLLQALTQEKLNNQKDVVMNERRQRFENQPYGLSWEKLFSNLYTENHPYHWPTIGWMKDIEKFELADVKNFFKTYYTPNNATLVIGGNFDYEKTIDLVKKYFGDIEKGNPTPTIFVPEQSLKESKKIIMEDNVQLSRIHLAWQTEKSFSEDDAVLDILSDILTSTKNSRLYKTLVHEKQIVQDINSFQYSANLAGSFIIISTAKPDVSLEIIKDEIMNEINNLIHFGITTNEIEQAKNSIKSTFIYSLQKIELITDHINHYNFYLNEPDSFLFDLNRYDKVTAEDVVSAAKNFLLKPFVELNIIPRRNNSAITE